MVNKTLGSVVDRLTRMFGIQPRGHEEPRRKPLLLEYFDEDETMDERAYRLAFTDALRQTQ